MELVILSNYAPDEIYIKNEIEYFENFENVYIFFLKDETYKNTVLSSTKNIHIYRLPEPTNNRKKFIFECFLQLFNYKNIIELFYIFTKKKFSFRSVSRMITFRASSVLHYKNVLEILSSIKLKDEIIFYAYRMAPNCLTIMNLKKNYKNSKCVSRCHGIDLYEYRNEDNYLPFRKEILQGLSAVYCISDDGKKYIEKYDFKTCPIKTAKLGTRDNGIQEYCMSRKLMLKIVSCSRITEIKRLDKIIEALTEIKDISIKWTHIGDGELHNKIESAARKELGHNIEIEFLGNLSNDDLLEKYKKEEYDVFLNVSWDEGIPVSIMEAISYGIPAIATDVGGTSEIVKDNFNGYLLKRDFSNIELVSYIRKIYEMSDEEYMKLRKNARDFWKKNYDAKTNYKNFADELKTI